MAIKDSFNREAFYQKLDEVYASNNFEKIESFLKEEEWTQISKRELERPCCRLCSVSPEEARKDHELIKNRLTIQNELLSLYRGAGRFASSLEIAKTMKEEMKEIGYQETDQYAIVLLNEATTCDKMGDSDQAAALFAESEEILSKLENVNPYLLCSLYNNRAPLHMKKGDFQKALDDLRQALAILRELGGRKLEEAITLVTMSAAYNGLSQFEQGEQSTDQAIALYKEMEEDPHQAAAYNMKAQYLYMKKQYKEAADLFKSAASITKKYFGENHDYQVCMRNAALALNKVYE